MHNPELVASVLPSSACLGEFDHSTSSDLKQPAPNNATKSDPPTVPTAEYPPLSFIISVNDFEVIAKRYLSDTGWAYYASGADDMVSVADSLRLWRLLKLRPRILRDVTFVNTSTTILGHGTTLPVYISPTGLGKYAHREAECALARAAGKEGLVQVVPTAPSRGHDDIVAAGKESCTVMMFQLYVNQDRQKAVATIKRAEQLGYKAIWITVDSPVLGKREMDDRIKAKEGRLSAGPGIAKVSSSGLLNPGLVWEDVRRIRELTSLPLVLKGVQSVEDAVTAWREGLDGIVLSNHGGRSVDAAQAPLITLLEIRRYAPHILGKPRKQSGDGSFEVYLDGGIRRGTDVIKALALGCTAVGVGRPFLYSMTGDYGEEGVRHLITILRSEIETNMALVGAKNIRELDCGMVNSRRAELEVIDAGCVKL